MGVDERQLALALERALSCQALVEHATERIDVGAPVDLPARDLLGRDVVEGADEAAVAGQAAHGCDVAGKAEVAHVRALAVGARGDEDVGRLDVAMNEIGGMGGVERVRDLRDQVERPRRLERAVLAEQLAEV